MSADKVSVNRSFEVIRNGEKIGAVCPSIIGWSPVDIDGKISHYTAFQTRRECVARVVEMFDRQSA